MLLDETALARLDHVFGNFLQQSRCQWIMLVDQTGAMLRLRSMAEAPPEVVGPLAAAAGSAMAQLSQWSGHGAEPFITSAVGSKGLCLWPFMTRLFLACGYDQQSAPAHLRECAERFSPVFLGAMLGTEGGEGAAPGLAQFPYPAPPEGGQPDRSFPQV